MPQVKIIQPIAEQAKKLRVAACARVSSDSTDQLNFFATQVDYYTNYIQSKDEWEFASLYADEAVSRTTADKRSDFQRLLADCRAGKIDRILVKSISRFAWNTIDCIKHVRILKSWGIPVIFEKENIDTSNMNSEMILTCLSSFAQAESESISGNVTKGIRMGYRQGRFTFRYKNFLGYRKGPDGEPEIVLEEAEIIRLIAQNFMNGDSLRTIKKTLEDMGVPTATGNKNWSTESIQRILQNEKYMGDVLLQKTYTADFIFELNRGISWQSPGYHTKSYHMIQRGSKYSHSTRTASIVLGIQITSSSLIALKIFSDSKIFPLAKIKIYFL